MSSDISRSRCMLRKKVYPAFSWVEG